MVVHESAETVYDQFRFNGILFGDGELTNRFNFIVDAFNQCFEELI
jgi:hypothetical protein